MSDCTNGGRRVYNVPTHSPSEDRLEITAHFKGDIFPRMFVINRLDREVDYVEVDGERFERVRECEPIIEPWQSDATRYDAFCGNCKYPIGDGAIKPWEYCPNCGAKVKVSA